MAWRLLHNILDGNCPSDVVSCLIRGVGVVVLVVVVVVTDLETAASTGFVLMLPEKGCRLVLLVMQCMLPVLLVAVQGDVAAL